MLPPLFLLEAGTIRFQEGYSEKGRKGNHLYFSRNVKIAAKTLDRGGGMHYPIKHTKMIGNGGAGHEPGYHSAAAVPLAEQPPLSFCVFCAAIGETDECVVVSFPILY